MYFVFNQGRLIVGISLPDDDGIGIRGGHTVVIKEYDENSDAYKLMDSGDETAKAVPRNRQTVLQQLMLYVADNIDFDTLDGPMLDATNLFESYYKENDEISWAVPARIKRRQKWLLDDDAYSLEFRYTRQSNNAVIEPVTDAAPNLIVETRPNRGTEVKPKPAVEAKAEPVTEASLETITEVSPCLGLSHPESTLLEMDTFISQPWLQPYVPSILTPDTSDDTSAACLKAVCEKICLGVSIVALLMSILLFVYLFITFVISFVPRSLGF